ncbi:MAG TPA: MDR family oxidoreductase [Geminicoccaceae bacterium]|nr:MDR family oxidoreductase [Geminicoccaceae bacterium]
MTTRFKALVLDQRDETTAAAIKDLTVDDLPQGDVLVDVAYSTLNYKDGLAITGKAPIVRGFPMVPGIDFAGTVATSEHPEFARGDEVVLTGWGVGERHWGGMAQMARVKGDWLVKLPEGLTPRRAMAIGTAGFTAMLAVMALEEAGLRPEAEAEVQVTGAGGGVGGVALAVLAKLGHRVVAVSGRPELESYLRSLGATGVIGREALTGSERPLESARFAGAVDSVGGDVLAGLLKGMRQGAAVAACGNAGGVALNTTVLPFILRGVRLIGIDSVYCPRPRRLEAWGRLARDLPVEALDAATAMAPLADVPRLAGEILAGRLRGRTVIDVNA